MVRRTSSPEPICSSWQLAERLRTIRVELYGERSLVEMAHRIGLPVRTWQNYEAGVTVPAEVLLRFVELTGVEPAWLLHGRGPKFSGSPLLVFPRPRPAAGDRGRGRG
jgi:hypothetical protein